MEEIWKDIEGTNGEYQASDKGRYRSLKYGKIRILKPGTDSKKYLVAYLHLNGVQKAIKVHSLVWQTFNGIILEKLQIDHINGIKSDNRLENLRLLTNRENKQAGMDAKRNAGNTYSKYRGLTYDNFGKRWVVMCHINGKPWRVGYYKDEEEAHMASENARNGIYPPRLQAKLEKQKKQQYR